MSVLAILAEHVGHRCVLRDVKHLRCVDCDRTILLPSPLVDDESTSTSSTPPPECSQHPGQVAASCGGCRADALAADEQQWWKPRGADPTRNADWQAAREQLARGRS